MNTVNIVMATYNGQTYIAEQIESILGSTYTDWSLFLCDDGSTDNTLEIAREYERKYPERIHIIENEKNLGVTRNFLVNLKRLRNGEEEISKSSSNPAKYYMFSDQDDVWFPEKIEMSITRMQALEKKYGKDKPFLVFSDTVVTDDALNEIHSSFCLIQRFNLCHLDFAHMLMENKCIGCTVMINDRLVTMLDEIPMQARYHDWWVGLIGSAFGKVSVIKRPTMYYRQHANNEVGSTSYANYFLRRIKTLKEQKQALIKTSAQAKEFYDMYEHILPEREKKIAYHFAHLFEQNWFTRRYILLHYRILKSGLLRNIGVLLIV